MHDGILACIAVVLLQYVYVYRISYVYSTADHLPNEGADMTNLDQPFSILITEDTGSQGEDSNRSYCILLCPDTTAHRGRSEPWLSFLYRSAP